MMVRAGRSAVSCAATIAAGGLVAAGRRCVRDLLTDRRAPVPQSEVNRRRSELLITDTELRLMAAAATIGLSSKPNAG
jgi:hypothetical protein